MGNFQIWEDYIELTDSMITLSSEDSNLDYSKNQMLDLAHLRRHTRTAVKTEVTIDINFGSTKAIKAVFLNDINFTDIYIEGSTNGTDWVFSQQFTISKDKKVNRYKIHAALTGFYYQYMRIRITAQDPVDGLSIFRIGTLMCTENIFTFTQNPTYPYRYRASYPEPLEVKFPDGGFEQVSQGSYKKWTGEFGFDLNVKENELELWTLDAIDITAYLVFYENNNDSSKAYLCKKKEPLEIQWSSYKIIKTNLYIFEEVI